MTGIKFASALILVVSLFTLEVRAQTPQDASDWVEWNVQIFEDVLDEDNSGQVEMDEWVVMYGMYEWVIDEWYEKDTNHDGYMTLPEWLDWVPKVEDEEYSNPYDQYVDPPYPQMNA